MGLGRQVRNSFPSRITWKDRKGKLVKKSLETPKAKCPRSRDSEKPLTTPTHNLLECRDLNS